MLTKTKTLVLAMTAGLIASGAVVAQDRVGQDFNAPVVAPVEGPLLPGTICSTVPGAINCEGVVAPPDFVSQMAIEDCATVRDVNLGVDASSLDGDDDGDGFISDLQLTLVGPDGTTQLMVQGDPVPDGRCPGSGMYVNLDDGGSPAVQTVCFIAPPSITGVLSPTDSLSVFNGLLGTGDWSLQVQDVWPENDDQVLNDWSLTLVCDNTADVSVTKDADLTVVAGTQMTYSMTAFNDGPANAQNPSWKIERVPYNRLFTRRLI
jgi:hypothetical protein